MRKLVIAAMILASVSGGVKAFAENEELESKVKRHLSAIESSSEMKRHQAAIDLETELSDALNHARRLNNEARENMCNRLIAVYPKLGTSQHESATKDDVAEVVTAHCTSPAAKKFIFQLMEQGPDSIRRSILTFLGSWDGLRDDEMYSKLDEWSARGFMKKSARPAYWVRMRREKAVPDILKVIDGTDDKEEVIYAARALQDVGSVEDMTVVYRKALKIGLNKPYRDFSDGLYWVDGRKLTGYVQKVDGRDLDVILELMGASTALTPAEVLPVLTAKLKAAKGETENLIIKRLLQAADNPRIDHDQVIRSLREKLSAEGDPKTREQLAKSLKEMDGKEAAAKEFLEHEQEWIRRNRK